MSCKTPIEWTEATWNSLTGWVGTECRPLTDEATAAKAVFAADAW